MSAVDDLLPAVRDSRLFIRWASRAKDARSRDNLLCDAYVILRDAVEVARSRASYDAVGEVVQGGRWGRLVQPESTTAWLLTGAATKVAREAVQR